MYPSQTMYNIIKMLVISSATLLPLGCQTAKSIELTHKQSQMFYKNFELDKKGLSPFIDNNILFTTSIKSANHEDYWIWFGFSSDNKTSVFINEVVIKGNNIQKKISINENCLINKLEERDSKVYNIYSGNIKIEMKNEELLKFVDNNQMNFQVSYTLNGETKKINFLINQRIIRQTIFPT